MSHKGETNGIPGKGVPSLVVPGTNAIDTDSNLRDFYGKHVVSYFHSCQRIDFKYCHSNIIDVLIIGSCGHGCN